MRYDYWCLSEVSYRNAPCPTQPTSSLALAVLYARPSTLPLHAACQNFASPRDDKSANKQPTSAIQDTLGSSYLDLMPALREKSGYRTGEIEPNNSYWNP